MCSFVGCSATVVDGAFLIAMVCGSYSVSTLPPLANSWHRRPRRNAPHGHVAERRELLAPELATMLNPQRAVIITSTSPSTCGEKIRAIRGMTGMEGSTYELRKWQIERKPGCAEAQAMSESRKLGWILNQIRERALSRVKPIRAVAMARNRAPSRA
jgi:hypothetical protein